MAILPSQAFLFGGVYPGIEYEAVLGGQIGQTCHRVFIAREFDFGAGLKVCGSGADVVNGDFVADSASPCSCAWLADDGIVWCLRKVFYRDRRRLQRRDSQDGYVQRSQSIQDTRSWPCCRILEGTWGAWPSRDR
jgi:hypothetical protein